MEEIFLRPIIEIQFRGLKFLKDGWFENDIFTHVKNSFIMRNFLVVFSLFLFLGKSFAQNFNLNQYQYVVIPERFDFQSEANQYQLNEMVRFYFEKNGFNAFLSNNSPNVERCSGLYARVEKKSGWIGIKVQVVLQDCRNVEVYKSPEGSSKFKEFEKAYQDATRKALAHLEDLNVSQAEISEVPVAQKPDVVQVEVIKKETSSSRISSGYTSYKSGEEAFLLRKTEEGFSLYKDEENPELIGKIILIGNIAKYIDLEGNTSDVSFDDNQFSIEFSSGEKIFEEN